MTDRRKTELLSNFIGWFLDNQTSDEGLFRDLHVEIGMTKDELHDFSIDSLDELFDRAEKEHQKEIEETADTITAEDLVEQAVYAANAPDFLTEEEQAEDMLGMLGANIMDEGLQTVDSQSLIASAVADLVIKQSIEDQTEGRYTLTADTLHKLSNGKMMAPSEDYDPNRAVEYLIDSAKQNNPVAKYLLGKLFLKGEHIPKNVDYALRWLEEAVEDGNPYAEYLLGKTLLKGEDTEQDAERAEDLLRRSADQGNRYAAYTLGKALLDGDVLPQDIPEAIRLLGESADSGFSQAQYVLGKLLYRGELTEQDIPKALEYLEKASAQKNPYAAYLAGKIRLTEDAHKDIAKAMRHFEIAAEGGNDYAEYQLGKLYLYGKEIPQDYDKTIEYLTASAEHGNKYADQLLLNIKNNRNWSSGMGVFRLFHHLGRLLQNQLNDDRGGAGGVDRKLRRQINEKKQAHGLRL